MATGKKMSTMTHNILTTLVLVVLLVVGIAGVQAQFVDPWSFMMLGGSSSAIMPRGVYSPAMLYGGPLAFDPFYTQVYPPNLGYYGSSMFSPFMTEMKEVLRTDVLSVLWSSNSEYNSIYQPMMFGLPCYYTGTKVDTPEGQYGLYYPIMGGSPIFAKVLPAN